MLYLESMLYFVRIQNVRKKISCKTPDIGGNIPSWAAPTHIVSQWTPPLSTTQHLTPPQASSIFMQLGSRRADNLFIPKLITNNSDLWLKIL